MKMQLKDLSKSNVELDKDVTLKDEARRSGAEDAEETRFKLEVTSNNAHQILEKLGEKLGVSRFGIICNGDDNPVLRAAAAIVDGLAAETSVFEKLQLASIKKKGTLVAGERSIALWKLSEFYRRSPIVFKDGIGMALEEYAFWMRKPVAEVEKIFCQEVINDLMKFIKRDPLWRVWTGIDWIEIDPWKFAVEVDLTSKD